MKEVLCFLNELDFADKLDNDCLEKMVGVMVEILKIILYPK